MALVMGVRFAAYGRSSPIIVAEKVFRTEYGRYGDEPKSYEVHIRHYEQMSNTLLFSDVADKIDEIITLGKLKGVKILADYTEIGKAAIDDLREKRILITPMVTTDSDKETVNGQGGYNVPVRDMVAITQRLLLKKRLKFAAGINGVETLSGEVAATYREDSQYSDAALLLCMVTWWADRFIAEYKRALKIPKAGRL